MKFSHILADSSSLLLMTCLSLGAPPQSLSPIKFAHFSFTNKLIDGHLKSRVNDFFQPMSLIIYEGPRRSLTHDLVNNGLNVGCNN